MALALRIHSYLGIGDKIQFSHIPENIYHFTGEKVVDLDYCWIFDNNPYVIRNDLSKVTQVIDLWSEYRYPDSCMIYRSHAHRFFHWFNLQFDTNYKNPILRHPRLYTFEDLPVKNDRVIVHTTGKAINFSMPDSIIEQIGKTYKDYEIIQVGGKGDKPTPFTNHLGTSIWEMARLIATSSTFIGVNSGPMNIANCYPRVNKKIIVNNNLETMYPLCQEECWFDYPSVYFNPTDRDIGITFSYLKL